MVFTIALLVLSIGVVAGGIAVTNNVERDRRAVAHRLRSYLK